MLDLIQQFQGGLLPRLAIDLVCMFILIRGIYFRIYMRADLFLTFFSFNLIIFLIAFVLNATEISIGTAFGLFAVFSMLRYRTESISTTDMTYLFLGISLGLIMAIGNSGLSHLIVFGVVILGFTYVLEGGILMRRELQQQVTYDRIDLVDTRCREDLLQDLQLRTGLNVHRVRIKEIDLVKNVARLVVYYYEDTERFHPGHIHHHLVATHDGM